MDEALYIKGQLELTLYDTASRSGRGRDRRQRRLSKRGAGEKTSACISEAEGGQIPNQAGTLTTVVWNLIFKM